MSEHVEARPAAESLFLQNLRDQTSVPHKKLEASPLSIRLMSADVGQEDYMNYLAAMRQVIAWTERVIFPVVAHVIPDIEDRRKLPAIEKDLAAYLPATAEKYFEPVDNPSLGTALGFMYVIEGSTLGGMVILKHIKERSFASGHTTNFFSGYGQRTGSTWRNFIDAFSAYVVQHRLEQQVIDGAKLAFQSIDNYFESHPVLS